MKVKQGEYLARNGNRITVFEVKQGSTFSVKGYVWKMFRGKYVPRTFSIWKENGQYSALGENPLDIVSEFN